MGETDAVDAEVDMFYTKVLVGERIEHFFEGLNIKRQASLSPLAVIVLNRFPLPLAFDSPSKSELAVVFL